VADDPLAQIREAIETVRRLPAYPESIKLTRAQMDVITDAAILDPDPPWRAQVNAITGCRIEIVETVEESTPYAMGWLPGAPDRP
jgi:hypothetical protein